MGTISSVLSSANSLTSAPITTSGSSSTSNTGSSTGSTDYFTGLSTYSQQLQEVISREVAIASLPIELLSSQQNTLNSQKTELTTLDSDFTAVQTAIQNISDALGGSGMTTTVSDPSVASVTAGGGATPGAYSIDVSSIGAYATSLTSGTWDDVPDASGQTTTYNLVVGANTYSFTPSDNSAATIASTINSQFGDVVQATAVNVGSAGSQTSAFPCKAPI
jgi:flagellar capping protein FliD